MMPPELMAFAARLRASGNSTVMRGHRGCHRSRRLLAAWVPKHRRGTAGAAARRTDGGEFARDENRLRPVLQLDNCQLTFYMTIDDRELSA
jgi:hypothetical protein